MIREKLKVEVIPSKGNINGIDYVICKNPVNAFCAYVRIPDNHKWFCLKKERKLHFSKRKIDVSYEMIKISCHGGLTFSERINGDGEEYPQKFTDGFWVGWDFAHYGDYVDYGTSFKSEGVHWTEQMVLEDIKDVIRQIRG